MENLADDPEFISAIVQEVKSQGLFDQFRKECLADVDTKPAYQNLRQRVEGSVSKFLAQQTWTDNIRHKNQLREKLRKHIIESGFLDTGVERIVDQVVNPKISTVFHPKIEEIVYNYLGIEKPKPVLNGGEMEVQTDFLPEDLEAVSPDSDKKSSSTSSDIAIKAEQTVNEELNESKEIVEDFESPAFEPLETRPPSQIKNESNDSHASAISGLTSQDSVGSGMAEFKQETSVAEDDVSEPVNGIAKECNGNDEEPSNGAVHPPEISPEVTQNDSQLSQVSSNSRLSIITNSEGNVQQQQSLQSQNPAAHNPRLDITEEAQMPRFNENSNEEGELPDSGGDEEPTESDGDRGQHKSNFDLRKESYEFKGTERNQRYLDVEMEKPTEPVLAENKAADVEAANEKPPIAPEDQPKPCPSGTKIEENSSHSERSLRICEDSTLEQKAQDTASLQENCESVKTPLMDETQHSTHSAPDVDKVDSTQVEVASLSAVQQHSEKEPKSERHRERDHKRSSSSRDKRSHSKQGSSSSSSNSSSRKSDHRDRKSENGNSNHGSSKRSSGEKRKEDDDHYSSHEKPAKKRRSTDRDSDGAENGKSSNTGGEGNASSGKGANDSAKTSHGSQKRGNGTQDKLNESLESSFEGFDEEQIGGKKERKSTPTKKSDKGSKTVLSKSADKGKSSDGAKGSKKVKKASERSPQNKSGSMTMDVFSFSFDKPAKLLNGEIVAENEPEPEVADEKPDVLREEVDAVPSQESIGNFDEVIVLDPAELEQAINANENADSQQVTSSVDDNALEETNPVNFPTTDPADLVTLSSQPVVVDQMLSNGDNMDLELLIGDQKLRADESTMGTIQKGLDVVKNKVRKPKIASNFTEACKLMKVRRQMERQEKKKREQAMVLAKKLINENGTAMEEDQGIELEFVCDATRTNSAPIISSPIRQKSKPTNGEEEQSLLYFPEEQEQYPVDDKLVAFLKQKTEKATFPNDYSVECFKIKLHLLQEPKEPPKELFPDAEEDEIMAVEITDVDEISSENCSVVLERINMNSPKWQKLRAPSVDSDGANSQDSNSSSLDVPPNEEGSDKITETNKSEETAESKDSDESADTGNPPIARGGPKSRRVGLSRPRGAALNNNTTAILKVDIADVKPPGPTADRKAGSAAGDIKAQRYTASDLYKPTLNGLRTRRSRANEGLSM